MLVQLGGGEVGDWLVWGLPGVGLFVGMIIIRKDGANSGCKRMGIYHLITAAPHHKATTVGKLQAYQGLYKPWWEELKEWGDVDKAVADCKEKGLRNCELMQALLGKLDLKSVAATVGQGSAMAPVINRCMQFAAGWPAYPKCNKENITAVLGQAGDEYEKYKSLMLVFEQFDQLRQGCPEASVVAAVGRQQAVRADSFLRGFFEPLLPAKPAAEAVEPLELPPRPELPEPVTDEANGGAAAAEASQASPAEANGGAAAAEASQASPAADAEEESLPEPAARGRGRGAGRGANKGKAAGRGRQSKLDLTEPAEKKAKIN